MHGRNGKAELPLCSGVFSLNLDFQNVISLIFIEFGALIYATEITLCSLICRDTFNTVYRKSSVLSFIGKVVAHSFVEERCSQIATGSTLLNNCSQFSRRSNRYRAVNLLKKVIVDKINSSFTHFFRSCITFKSFKRVCHISS